MISFDEAVDLVRSVAKPLGAEPIAIERAGGRVLASPVIACIDSPRADVSAMDGYAVRTGDLAHIPASLKVVGESFAGAGWRGRVEAGTCARIFTGAPVPDGADRIVVQENVRRDGDIAIIDNALGPERYIRERGGDFAAGEVLLTAGRLLDERAIVAAAAADLAELQVYRRPRVTVLSTGDELAAPGTARERADAVPDSISLGVAALAERWGAQCVGWDRLPDDLALLERAAGAALERADLIVVTGGASVGEKDFAKAMFKPAGLELIFTRVAIRPGKPAWLGRAGGRLVIGLPGNPTSALVTARLLLAPMIALMVGRPTGSALQWTTGEIASALPACGERETFHRARLEGGTARLLSFQESSAQKALAEADVLVRQRANTPAVATGETVELLHL
ncbi:MAG: molybdopterin molybdotransferase MoeA [Sphingomicrobium sp.]